VALLNSFCMDDFGRHGRVCFWIWFVLDMGK